MQIAVREVYAKEYYCDDYTLAYVPEDYRQTLTQDETPGNAKAVFLDYEGVKFWYANVTKALGFDTGYVTFDDDTQTAKFNGNSYTDEYCQYAEENGFIEEGDVAEHGCKYTVLHNGEEVSVWLILTEIVIL